MKRILTILFFLISHIGYADDITQSGSQREYLFKQCLRIWGLSGTHAYIGQELYNRCFLEIEEGRIFTPTYASPISEKEERYTFNNEDLKKIQISYPTVLKINFLRALDKILSESQVDINKVKANGTIVLRVGMPSEFDIVIYDGKKMLSIKGNYIIYQNNFVEVKR